MMLKRRRKESEQKKLRDVTAVADGLYGPIYSERVIFILDKSGSMDTGTGGKMTRWQAAKWQLKIALENLSDRSYFNIIGFSRDVVPFKKSLVKSQKRNLEKAFKFIDGLEVGGETNIYGALQAAFQDPEMDTIYLLSDGAPTVGEIDAPSMIRDMVSGWNRDRMAIIMSIGFFPGEVAAEDKEEARRFLQLLATENDGDYKEIF